MRDGTFVAAVPYNRPRRGGWQAAASRYRGADFFAVIASGLLTYCCGLLVAKGAAKRLSPFARSRREEQSRPATASRRWRASLPPPWQKSLACWRPHEFPSSEFAEVDRAVWRVGRARAQDRPLDSSLRHFARRAGAPRQGTCRSILDRTCDSAQRQGLGAASSFAGQDRRAETTCRRCRWRPSMAFAGWPGRRPLHGSWQGRLTFAAP